jgi:MFS family permease
MNTVPLKLSAKQHFAISIYWFATNFHWGAILLILLPGDMQVLAGNNKALWLGYMTGIGAVPALVVPLIAGALSDRSTNRNGRRRPFIVKGVVLNVVGLIGMALVVTTMKGNPLVLWAYALGYIIVQIGNNIASGAFMGIIPDLVPPSDRGTASGWMALMSQGGTLLGSVAIGMLLGDASTLFKYLLIAFVMLAITAYSWFSVKETPIEKAEPIEWVSYVKSLWIDPKKYPDFAWVWITRFLVMMGFYAVLPFVNYYMVDVVGIPQKEVGSKAPLLLGLILIVSSISGIYGGIISDKIGRKKVVYVANAMIAVIAPVFVFCHSLPTALVVGAVFGLGYGAYVSVDYAMGTDVLPNKDDAGKDMAVWHVAMTLPQSLTAPLAGFLIALPGKEIIKSKIVGEDDVVHYKDSGYAMVFILCSICFALGAYLLKNVKKVK